jgi:hypothetical protein
LSQSADPRKINWRFNPITPEDWRANEAPLADLYQRGIVSAEYVRERLNIPESAGEGTMFKPPPMAPKPLNDIPKDSGEKWRLKQTKNGVIAERLQK